MVVVLAESRNHQIGDRNNHRVLGKLQKARRGVKLRAGFETVVGIK